MEGRDGHHRGAIVKTTSRDGQTIQLRRPIQLLYPLELEVTSDDKEVSADTPGSSNVVNPSEDTPVSDNSKDTLQQVTDTHVDIQRRPRRAAAQRGEDQRKACMLELEED